MYAMVHGYSSYSTTITASYETSGGGCTGSSCLENGIPKTGLSGSAGSESFYEIAVPANSRLAVQMSGGTGDGDLYVKQGAQPTDTDYDCRPYKNGNSESCSLNITQAGTVYIRVKGYSTYSGISLTASY